MARPAPGQIDQGSRIEAAFRHIPADDRNLWPRVGMAIKGGLGEDGFERWIFEFTDERS